MKLEIEQCENRSWRYRWRADDIWKGGFNSYTEAYDAAMQDGGGR